MKMPTRGIKDMKDNLMGTGVKEETEKWTKKYKNNLMESHLANWMIKDYEIKLT